MRSIVLFLPALVFVALAAGYAPLHILIAGLVLNGVGFVLCYRLLVLPVKKLSRTLQGRAEDGTWQQPLAWTGQYPELEQITQSFDRIIDQTRRQPTAQKADLPQLFARVFGIFSNKNLMVRLTDAQTEHILLEAGGQHFSDDRPHLQEEILEKQFSYGGQLYVVQLFSKSLPECSIDSVLESIPGIVGIFDPQLHLRQVNQQLATLLNTDQLSLIGTAIHDRPALSALVSFLSRFASSDKLSLEKEITLTVLQKEHHFMIYVSRNTLESDITLVGIDITRLKQAEEKWRKQSSRDSLTGLANRIQFNAQLAIALERSEQEHSRLAILFFDLDRFRIINDSLGHIIGDLLLQSVAGVVRDELVACYDRAVTARWGGDEFTILLPNVGTSERAIQVAQRLLARLDQDFGVGGYSLHTTASIGIAFYPDDGEDNETLIKNADAALHFAKSRGRNNWQVYSQAMNSRSHDVLVLENSLHRAIAHQEFAVYYQPKVSLQTNRITGLEALIRWHHPELGLVMPNDFVPLSEENGMVVPIGEWVIQTVCQQNRLWHQRGLPMIPIAVNLSARQFLHHTLFEMVDRALQQASISAEFLEIEITESLAMNDMEMTRAILKRFYEMGIKITIDDFGTGYSSLNSLKKFPVHTLKIDKSFIRDIDNDPHDRAIVQAITALGEGLNLNVIGEGVETIRQLEILRSLGCQEVQGYLFCRPIPTDQLTKLLEDTGGKLLVSA